MNNKKKVGKIVAAVAACLALAVVILSSFTVVDAGHTGVIMTFGAVSDTVQRLGGDLSRTAPTPAPCPRPHLLILPSASPFRGKMYILDNT